VKNLKVRLTGRNLYLSWGSG